MRGSCAVLLACSALAVAPPSMAQTVVYPQAKRGNVVDDYFGTRVPDPYRWMEDLNSAQTKAWVQTENAFTSAYLAQFPLRDTLRARLTQLYDYSRTTLPVTTTDGKLFYRRNSGLQNQAVLFMRASASAAPVTVIDPNSLSSDGQIALQEWAPSPDGHYVAYALSQGGADWRTVHVRDVTNGTELADSLQWVRFSGLSWTRDGHGFFYSRFPQPLAGHELSAALTNHAVYYHVVGTPQSQDQVIFALAQLARYFVDCHATDDGKYLFCTASAGSDNRNQLYFADLGDPMHPNVTAALTPIIGENIGQFTPIGTVGGTAYLLTDLGAPLRKIVALNLSTPDQAHLQTLVPESKYAIQSATIAGDRIVVHYLEDVKSIVRTFDLQGRPTGAIPLPEIGTVSGIAARSDSPVLYYIFTSPLVPPSVYSFNVDSRETKTFDRPKLTFDPSAFETREVFATSKDGTRIPLFITLKKGTMLDGSHQAMLYAYGGFDISVQPTFAPEIVAWVERGGIYVTANLRGGSEYGEAWHRAGMLDKKQNVFDDFIAAAQYLVSQHYTSSGKLVIEGASNGGLLIGAVTDQRPDLFGVALPNVGVMDMLRYDKFTGGAAWATEYGTSSDSAAFSYLYRYSPLQNIHPGTCYPATFAMTADHDDRVVPSHTFKYIATLQAAQGCSKPVLVRIQTQGSHGYLPTDKRIAESADQLTFALVNAQ